MKFEDDISKGILDLKTKLDNSSIWDLIMKNQALKEDQIDMVKSYAKILEQLNNLYGDVESKIRLLIYSLPELQKTDDPPVVFKAWMQNHLYLPKNAITQSAASILRALYANININPELEVCDYDYNEIEFRDIECI